LSFLKSVHRESDHLPQINRNRLLVGRKQVNPETPSTGRICLTLYPANQEIGGPGKPDKRRQKNVIEEDAPCPLSGKTRMEHFK
jgi:hypothetical protein